MSTRLKLPPGITNSAGTFFVYLRLPRASRGICGGWRHLVKEFEERVDPSVDIPGGAGLLGSRPEELVCHVERGEGQASGGIDDGGATNLPERPFDVGDQLPNVLRRRL